MNAETALSLENLSYAYRSNWLFTRFQALKPINLSLMRGESIGFLGHNGAGKTTTIKCILGLIRPSSGRALIFGTPSTDPESRRRVGYLPEQPYFYDNLTVLETVRMYATLTGLSRAERENRVRQVLEQVKLGGKIRAPMRALSKGLMQRVALAQAIVGEPELLILDEPFSGLDPIGRKEFRDIFFSLKKRGATIFMCSHILSDVEFLCDRVSILSHGELKGVFNLSDVPRLAGASYELVLRDFEGHEESLRALASNSLVQDKFLRLEFAEREKALTALNLALARKVSVESYQCAQGSLEDLFVKLVQFDEGSMAKASPL